MGQWFASQSLDIQRCSMALNRREPIQGLSETEVTGAEELDIGSRLPDEMPMAKAIERFTKTPVAVSSSSSLTDARSIASYWRLQQ